MRPCLERHLWVDFLYLVGESKTLEQALRAWDGIEASFPSPSPHSSGGLVHWLHQIGGRLVFCFGGGSVRGDVICGELCIREPCVLVFLALAQQKRCLADPDRGSHGGTAVMFLVLATQHFVSLPATVEAKSRHLPAHLACLLLRPSIQEMLRADMVAGLCTHGVFVGSPRFHRACSVSFCL